MFQFILDQALAPGRRGRIFRKLMFWILHVYDPIVHYSLNGKCIALNLSHQLPFTRKEYPTYSDNLSRLASFIRQHFGNLQMIDIGANIGDSHALAKSAPGDRFLLIEGSPEYMDLLTANTKDDAGVTRVQALLTDRSYVGKGQVIAEDGTARVGTDDPSAQSVHYQTLDELIQKYQDFGGANLLKSDVDGYDSRVLVGGKHLITSKAPVIFFEHHPHLLALAGDDDKYIFPLLKEWGYSKLIFYDIKGFLFGPVDSGDTKLLDNLMFYAKSKAVLCYDVCCFHDRDAAAREEFLISEKKFYAELISRNLQHANS
jgi:FkbM family methyltransferase